MKTLNSHLRSQIVSLNKYNTFIVIKPGFTKKASEIISMFLMNGYIVVKSEAKRLTLSQAQALYASHKDEDFYKDLCKYMSRGWSAGYCLDYTGPGNPFTKTDSLKKEIRDKYGKDDMRNAMHSSDSPEAVMSESFIYFNN